MTTNQNPVEMFADAPVPFTVTDAGDKAATNVHPFPAIKPGHRLVPALIGNRKSAQVAYIECPNWCGDDHVTGPAALEDITHTSRSEDVHISSFLRRDDALLMFATIEQDPAAKNPLLRAAHVAVEDGDAPHYFTPDMAEALADDLIGFASQLRHLARTARLHNTSQGDSDPDMNEALRRVREGGVA
ncbi:DUF6907 domain-containing protein [Streptomyces chartreusis]|uniref:Uncharacterized protein n=1 Tax=Streptomyces chartreusis TaxID=1969 RepID=A0A7H8TF79_STRCX|nr:hypothetical protein [Streptomyces chartreusis]QKZ22054.1 hypothetical protein HUT05_34725 [Streptomyces chartreusis]